MYLHIRSDIKSGYSDMCRKISEYNFPAMILDGDRYIKERNEYADTKVLPVRKGARIDKYLSESDLEKVKTLSVGEQADIDLGLPSVFGTVIFRAQDYYLLIGREFTALLKKHVFELYNRMPGYDKCISIGMEMAMSDSDRNALKKCFGDIARINLHLKEFFGTVSGSYQNDFVPFNAGETANNVISCAKDIIKPFFIQQQGFPPEKALFTRGSETDFIMILAAMISFAFKHSSRGNMIVSLEHRNGEIETEIQLDSTLESATIAKLVSSRFKTEDFGRENGIMFFDMYLLELMADRNMWDFTITESTDICGRIFISLRVPEYEERKAETLRDSSPLGLFEIVRAELGSGPFKK